MQLNSQKLMKSRRLMATPRLRDGTADMCSARGNVRVEILAHGLLWLDVFSVDLCSHIGSCAALAHVASWPEADLSPRLLLLRPSHSPEESSPLCELLHIGMQRGHPIICIRTVHEYRERQMSYEFDRTYLEKGVMLSALALFLVLAFVMPA